MKRIFLVLYLSQTMVSMEAQVKTISPVGEYYLSGVMETASGFRISKDSTFDFFFSYGALDREGEGTWRMEGEFMIFNSKKQENKDFTIIKSEARPGKPFQIQISGAPSHISQYVHAKIKSGSKEETVQANTKGLITFATDKADWIELLFELCPDKSTVFRLDDNKLNYFEIKFEASITKVLFDNFRLHVLPHELKGPHPLMQQQSFVYKKVDH